MLAYPIGVQTMLDSVAEPNADALLDSKALSAALEARGVKVAKTTLDTYATRGGGPPFRKFGARRLYEWGTALEWVRERTSRAVRSTAELQSSAAAA